MAWPPDGIVQPYGCTLTRRCATVELRMIGGGMASIEREVTIPVPPEDVWPLMIDADQVSAWFGADVEIDPRPGGRATFRWADGTERAAMVEDVEPERRLAF